MTVATEKARIEYEITEPYDLNRYRGWDWWQLSDEEAEVFHLALEDMPALVEVHQLYYDVIDITSTIEEERAESLRAELPWLTKDSVVLGDWLRFAKLFDISNRSASAFWSKYEYWEVRQGLVRFTDEKEL